MVYFQTLLHTVKATYPDFALLVGPEVPTAESVIMGADGVVTGGATTFLALYVEMYNAAQNKDFETIYVLQKRIMQIATTLYRVGKYGSS